MAVSVAVVSVAVGGRQDGGRSGQAKGAVGAVARAARTLLLDELLARTGAFRTILDVVRAGHRLELLVTDHAVQQIGTGLETEDLVLECHRTGIFAV